MYNKICVIGLGTLGGFLAKNLSELETTRELLLIDYDTVEQENIRNSIYLSKDIGKLKTEAIYEKLENNSDAQIHILSKKFKEGLTKIENFDLIIDCRDFTYERKNLIDVRLSISYKNLIIDCRKNVKYKRQHEGTYATRLSKTELKAAALHATILIGNGLISELISKQLVHTLPIDLISQETREIIDKEKTDLIYDENTLDEKLINLHENYSNIIDLNKKNELTLYLGSKDAPVRTKVIQKNNLNSIHDIMAECSSIINTLPNNTFNYYLISINNYKNKHYVEILPETGSA